MGKLHARCAALPGMSGAPTDNGVRGQGGNAADGQRMHLDLDPFARSPGDHARGAIVQDDDQRFIQDPCKPRIARGAAAVATLLLAAPWPIAAAVAHPDEGDDGDDDSGSERRDAGALAERFRQLTRSSTWTQLDAIPVAFNVHHPQGMVRIENYFYLSSVEIMVPTEKYPQPVDGYDRTPGVGAGHVYKFSRNGELVDHVTLGEDTMYHPGGIDFDGSSLWVPVAEYRPNSRSIIYRVAPATMRAEEVFRTRDHIGGVVYNRRKHLLHGVSWGSRRLYAWAVAPGRESRGTSGARLVSQTLNGSHYVDYQDCQYVPRRYMLCGGLNHYQVPTVGAVALGGLELVDLADNRPVHQIPVAQWVHPRLSMATNPVFVEARGNSGLRLYFLPEDNDARLYVYDVDP